jgi:hypothetical protein
MAAFLEDRLQRAAALTFEDLAFMFTEFDLSTEQRAANFQAGAAMGFRGPFRGQLAVHLFGDLLPTLSANMVGEDQVTDPALQADTMKEIANVICGNLLPMIAGPAAVFDLEPPAFLDAPLQAPSPGLQAQASTLIGMEAGRAELILYADRRLELDE